MKKITVSILTTLLMLSMVFSSSVFAANEEKSALDSLLGLFSGKVATADTQVDGVTYRTHIENDGWAQGWVSDGDMSGSYGRGLRLEGIEIKLDDTTLPEGLGITYRTHIENDGWAQGWVSDGEMSGSYGRGLRLEAIEIKLTGDNADDYSVVYRTHIENDGWAQGWVKDGALSGSEGRGLRLEGIEIKIEQKTADLTAYEAALAAVEEADYTAASWTAYEAVVAANVVTEDNSQTEVDAATAIILDAQEDLVTKAVVTSATATNQNTITLQGTVLNKLAAADVKVAGITVSSITPNADGTSATVKLASDLVADKDYKVTVTSDGTASEFTVKYTIAGQVLAVTSGMYDRNLTNQKLALTLDGVPVTTDYLAANGYIVTFYAYTTANVADGTLFNGPTSSATGAIYVPQAVDGTYLVQATAIKGSTILTSEKATIQISDIINNGTAINSYKMTQGSPVTKIMNSTTLVTGATNEETTINNVVVQYSSTNTVELTNGSGYVLSTSDKNIISVNGDKIKAVAPGTATITIQVGKLTKEIAFTVTQAERVATTITATSPANAFINGGAITSSNTITVLDQFGDPCVGMAPSKFVTATPTNYDQIKYAQTGSIGGFAFGSTAIAAAGTDPEKGKYTVSYVASSPADGQTQTIVFTNKAGTSVGNFTVKAVANNGPEGYKVEYKGGSANQSNTLNNNMADLKKIELVVNEYNSDGVKLGQKADITGFTVLYDPNMVIITGYDSASTPNVVAPSSDADGKFVCGATTKYIELTPKTTAGTTPIKVYTDNTLVEQIDNRTITVASSTPKITAVTFKTVTPLVGTIDFKNVLTTTERVDKDSIITSGLTLSEVTGYDVCIHDVTTTSSSPAASEAPDNKTIYLDKNRDGTYQTGEKIGELVFTINNTQGIALSSNQVIITTGAKGSFTYTVWDTTPTNTAPVVVAYNTVLVDLVGSVPVTGISVTTAPTKTAYQVGESFDSTGMVVTATYAGGTTAAVTGYTVTGFDSTATGIVGTSPTVTVSYGGQTDTQAYTVTKTTPVISGTAAAMTGSTGAQLSIVTLLPGTLTAVDAGGNTVAGTFTWTTDTTVLSAGADTYDVTFTPDDTTNFNGATTTASVTAS